MSQTTLARPASTRAEMEVETEREMEAEMEMELTDDELEAVVGGLRIPLQIHLPRHAAAA